MSISTRSNKYNYMMIVSKKFGERLTKINDMSNFTHNAKGQSNIVACFETLQPPIGTYY